MNIYKLLKLVINHSISYTLLSIQKHNHVFRLKKPKLLSYLVNQDIYRSILDNSISLTVEKKVKNFYLSKKEKTNSKKLDVLEAKKSKLSQRKKIRRRGEDIDELNDESRGHLDIGNSISESFVKTRRNVKARKNLKSNNLIDSRNKLSHIYSEKGEKQRINENKEIAFDSLLTIQELANKLSIPSSEIAKWLFLQGFAVTINQVVDLSVANLVAQHYGFTVLDKLLENTCTQNSGINTESNYNSDSLEARSPIITVFGHVDHGKTTLLDSIRRTKTVHLEVGGITQSIGTYELMLDQQSSVNKLIFLDTPGHEAFRGMRARSAEVTDIAVLVVSADDGLKPQTIEAINHIKFRKIPFIVVINKIDKSESNVIKVKEELAQFNVYGKDYGGEISIIEISALRGYNIDLVTSELIKMAENQDLKSDPNQTVSGTILEAHLDKHKGAIAKVLIHNGTLHIGDIIIAENTYAKIKVIINAQKQKVKLIKSVSIVEIWGFVEVPIIGSKFMLVADEKKAKSIILKHDNRNNDYTLLNTRVKSDLYKKQVKRISIILKADQQGSLEAILNCFSNISQEKVQINILSAESGEISGKDIKLASTSSSIIIGFNVNLSANIHNTVEQNKVIIKSFNVIYDLVNYVKNYMLSLTQIEYEKELSGKAIVKTVFTINRGSVAGCFVLEGKLKNKAYITVYRKKEVVYNGLLDSLKRLKENVNEVYAKDECGVLCNTYNTWQESDQIECYEFKPKEKSL